MLKGKVGVFLFEYEGLGERSWAICWLDRANCSEGRWTGLQGDMLM